MSLEKVLLITTSFSKLHRIAVFSCLRNNKNVLVSTYQNHRKMKIFSLIMFNAKTQRASCFWIVPVGPNLWNVHFVSLGNTSI